MDTVIDRFGRIVIPKELRDAMGLKAGSVLHILFGNQEIRLKPAENVVQMSKKGGITVIDVQLESSSDIVQQVRKSRISKVTGIPEEDL
jgi:AbrB family looped-hinge helix DNA binding protein